MSNTCQALDGTLITEEDSNQKPIQKAKAIFKHLGPQVVARFAKKAERDGGEDACWMWNGSVTSAGYPRFALSKEAGEALGHRVAWAIANSKDVPEGLEVDHICGTRACVNPKHLRAVDHPKNMESVQNRPCDTHDAGWFAKDSRGRVYCRSCFQDRFWEHALRLEFDAWPRDRSIAFLEWVWRGATARIGQIAVFGRRERTQMGKIVDVLDEHLAFHVICEVVRQWGRFSRFAATEYGAFYGNPDRAPGRPVLTLVASEYAAALNFWRENDRVQALIDRGGLPEVILRALVGRYGREALTRLPVEAREHLLASES